MKVIILSLLLTVVSLISFSAQSSDHCKETLRQFLHDTPWIEKGDEIKLPISWYQNYDSEEIGRLIVQRLHQKTELNVKKLNMKKGFNYKLKKVKVVLAARDSNVFDILETGEFRNFHQVRKTNGESTALDRRLVENRLVNLNYGDEGHVDKEILEKIKSVRPKSAYLFLGKQPKYTDLGGTLVRRQYGGIFAVLKNEIKERTTFTLYDSLAANRAYSFDIKPSAPLKAATDMMGEPSAYFEAQIYGRLSVEDVDYWLFDTSDLSRSELQELKESEGTTLYKMLQGNQAVYKAKYVNYGDRHEVTKGARIKP